MVFDVVIGNPPYNNGIDLEFTNKVDELSPNLISFIIPGKWHIKQDKGSIEFREKFLNRMSNIVTYIDCGDVFNIRLKGGITYFLIKREQQTDCKLKTYCERAKALESNGVEVRQLNSKNCFLYNENCYNIIKKVGSFEKEFIQWVFENKPMDGKYNVFGSAITADSGGKTSYNIFSKTGTIPVLPPLEIVRESTYKTNDIQCYFSGISEEEAKSFISWVNSKLIRFLLLMRSCTYHNNNLESWSFVPNQKEFSHIYSDKELYSKYGLNETEINIIESVIK